MTQLSPGPAPAKIIIAVTIALAWSAGSARAQTSPECQKISKLSQDRATRMMQIQSWQKAKTKPSASAVCSAFSELLSNGNALIPLIETHGAWCHVPEQAIAGLKQQQAGIGKTRANACKVAEQMKKMESQRAQGGGPQGPLGGTGDILGGPIKAPQGAL